MPLDQQILHVYVAMQNLAHGRPVNDIAEEIGKSRFVTARMVRRARDLGLIEVRPTVSVPIDVDLSAQLAQRFGLQSALVVATRSTDDAEVREVIASVTARFIRETVQEGTTCSASRRAARSCSPPGRSRFSRAPTWSS